MGRRRKTTVSGYTIYLERLKVVYNEKEWGENEVPASRSHKDKRVGECVCSNCIFIIWSKIFFFFKFEFLFKSHIIKEDIISEVGPESKVNTCVDTSLEQLKALSPFKEWIREIL